MIELLATIFTGVFGGGATGLLGVVIQKFFSLKERKLDLEAMAIQHTQSMALAKQEQDSRERLAAMGAAEREAIADLDARARENESADRLMAASYEHDAPRYHSPASEEMPPTLLEKSRMARWLATISAFIARMLMVSVDFYRGVIRPGLTVYSMYLLTILFTWVKYLYDKSQMTLSADQVWELTKMVIGTITFLGTAIPLWWFGIRANGSK
jgi:hypothetical protein